MRTHKVVLMGGPDDGTVVTVDVSKSIIAMFKMQNVTVDGVTRTVEIRSEYHKKEGATGSHMEPRIKERYPAYVYEPYAWGGYSPR